jgi:hypothetical protein
MRLAPADPTATTFPLRSSSNRPHFSIASFDPGGGRDGDRGSTDHVDESECADDGSTPAFPSSLLTKIKIPHASHNALVYNLTAVDTVSVRFSCPLSFTLPIV